MKIDPQFQVLTRTRRWLDGLLREADIVDEKELDICLLKLAHRRVQKYGTIQFENLIYQGDCLIDYIGEEISLRYDPRNIITLLAYTAAKHLQPSELIGVIKARNFSDEQMTLDELKWIVQKLRRQLKKADNISILHERYNHLNLIEEKRTEKRRKRRKKQHKRDKDHNQSKVTQIFPQNVLETDSEKVAPEPAKTANMGEKPKIRVKNQPLPPESHPRVGRRSSGIVTNVQNWSEYKKNNW
jgi:putative transposase